MNKILFDIEFIILEKCKIWELEQKEKKWILTFKPPFNKDVYWGTQVAEPIRNEVRGDISWCGYDILSLIE